MDCEKIIYDLIATSNYTDEEKNKILSYFESLLDDSVWLSCLEAAGVDNWSGYDEARKMQEELEEE